MPWKEVAKAVAPAVVSGVANIFGSSKQAKASNQATEASERASMEAIALEREKEARRRQEYDAMIAAEKAQWDAEQSRLQPFRDATLGILGGAADRLGYSLPQASSPALDTAAKAAKKFSLPTSDYLPGGSLASLSGAVPSTGGYERPVEAPPPMTLAELSRMRRAGDWRREMNV